MKACILVATKGAPNPLAERLVHYPGVQDAFAVRGRHEVIVRADLRGLAHLAELLDRVSATEGVIVSETLLEIPQVVKK